MSHPHALARQRWPHGIRPVKSRVPTVTTTPKSPGVTRGSTTTRTVVASERIITGRTRPHPHRHVSKAKSPPILSSIAPVPERSPTVVIDDEKTYTPIDVTSNISDEAIPSSAPPMQVVEENLGVGKHVYARGLTLCVPRSTVDSSMGSVGGGDPSVLVPQVHLCAGDDPPSDAVIVFRFPPSYGVDGQVLTTDGLGNLRWSTVAASADTSTSSTAPIAVPTTPDIITTTQKSSAIISDRPKESSTLASAVRYLVPLSQSLSALRISHLYVLSDSKSLHHQPCDAIDWNYDTVIYPYYWIPERSNSSEFTHGFMCIASAELSAFPPRSSTSIPSCTTTSPPPLITPTRRGGHPYARTRGTAITPHPQAPSLISSSPTNPSRTVSAGAPGAATATATKPSLLSTLKAAAIRHMRVVHRARPSPQSKSSPPTIAKPLPPLPMTTPAATTTTDSILNILTVPWIDSVLANWTVSYPLRDRGLTRIQCTARLRLPPESWMRLSSSPAETDHNRIFCFGFCDMQSDRSLSEMAFIGLICTVRPLRSTTSWFAITRVSTSVSPISSYAADIADTTTLESVIDLDIAILNRSLVQFYIGSVLVAEHRVAVPVLGLNNMHLVMGLLSGMPKSTRVDTTPAHHGLFEWQRCLLSTEY